MVLGAFIDIGISEQWLMDEVGKLGIGDVEIVVRDVKQNAIGAKQISVIENFEPTTRHLKDIKNILASGALDENAATIALNIFQRIAEAEARIHRCDIEAVHFHEVGAVDSIVDIVGAVLCLEKLQITSISSSPLPLGYGFVDCQHGRLPVPAPATVEILKGLPVYGGAIEGERVTPTGAAIIASIAQKFGPIPEMKVAHVGYGSGTYQHQETPNVLRLLLGQKTEKVWEPANDEVCVIETHIDDMNAEFFGYVMERLFDEAALDVCYTPIMMKKNRPGTKIEVICALEDQLRIENILFSETSTIGLRYQKVRRHTLKRKMKTLDTSFGPVEVKCVGRLDGEERCTPEYESCRRIALERKIPLKTVYDEVAKVFAKRGCIG